MVSHAPDAMRSPSRLLSEHVWEVVQWQRMPT
jgi:hypothetical protein